MNTTPLQLALTIFTTEREDDKADIIALAETGMFSINNICDITGASLYRVKATITKTSKTGGNLNPETLAMMYDLKLSHETGGRDSSLIRQIKNLGTSLLFVEKLTGISYRSLNRWMKEYEDAH